MLQREKAFEIRQEIKAIATELKTMILKEEQHRNLGKNIYMAFIVDGNFPSVRVGFNLT